MAATTAMLLAAWAVERACGSVAAAAYAGAAAECVLYYGIVFVRETRAGIAHGRRGAAVRLRVLREMLVEFGPAEALDLLVVRPFCLAVGAGWPGGGMGVVSGKLAADLAFYAPVVATREWRASLAAGSALDA